MTKEKKIHIHFTREHLLGLVLLAAAVCMALAMTAENYADKFLPRTEVNGVDCTALSPQDAAEAILREAGRETLELRDRSGELLYTGDMSALVDRDGLVRQLEGFMKQQKQDKGGLAFLLPGGYSYEAALFEGVTAGGLQQWLETELYRDTARVEPEDAYLELTVDSYRLVPEVVGNAVNTHKCALALMSCLPGYELGAADTHTVTVREGRQLPEHTADSVVLQNQLAELDRYFGSDITIDFENGNVITLDTATRMSFSEITVALGTVTVSPVEEQVIDWVTEQAELYGSHGVDRKYLHVAETRETVYPREGDWGWEMEVDRLCQDVLDALNAREDAIIAPDYYCTSYHYWRYGATTLVEISIDNQYMWFYLNGRLMTETPVVTGNVATWDITRKGVFEIYWKKADTVLRGPTWNDHVDFWMPFDDQIGLHDSAWRDEYGGDIYLTDGSHGCVNTPWEPMSIIFNNTWLGVMVVVY